MNRITWAIVLAALLAGGCDTAEQQAIPDTHMQTLQGLLRSDATVEGVASTGWVVEEDQTGVVQPVDLQLVIEQAQRLGGTRVTVRGTMQQRPAADGSTQPIFVAQSIEPSGPRDASPTPAPR